MSTAQTSYSVATRLVHADDRPGHNTSLHAQPRADREYIRFIHIPADPEDPELISQEDLTGSYCVSSIHTGRDTGATSMVSIHTERTAGSHDVLPTGSVGAMSDGAPSTRSLSLSVPSTYAAIDDGTTSGYAYYGQRVIVATIPDEENIPRGWSWPAGRRSQIANRDILLRTEEPIKVLVPSRRPMTTLDATPHADEGPVSGLSDRTQERGTQIAAPKFSGHDHTSVPMLSGHHMRIGAPVIDIRTVYVDYGGRRLPFVEFDIPEDPSMSSDCEGFQLSCHMHDGSRVDISSSDEHGDWARDAGLDMSEEANSVSPPLAATPAPPVPIVPVSHPDASASGAMASQPQPAASPVFNFGVEHHGRSYEETTRTDPGYYFWCIEQEIRSDNVSHYVDWVNENYHVYPDKRTLINRFTLGTCTAHFEPPEPLGTAHPRAKAKAKGKAKTNAEQRAAWSNVPKCNVCGPEFTTRGSNAYVLKRTCMTCGHVETQKKQREVLSAAAVAACPHTHTDRSGSTSLVCRISCRHCFLILSEEPQTERTRAAKTATSRPPGAPPGRSQPFVPERRNAIIPIEQMMIVVQTLKGLVKAYLSKHDEDTVTQSDFEELLSDAIDIVLDDVEQQSVARTLSRQALQRHNAVAMMHVAEVHSGPSHGAPPQRPRLYHHELETVDLKTDNRVFGMLDEGCNASCHGTAWAKHAMRAFARHGSHKVMSQLDPTNQRSYSGIGNKKSLGTRTVPWGMLYEHPTQDGIISAQGTIVSHEMEGTTPLLISLHAQGTLGLVKDVQSGTCQMKHRTGTGEKDYELVTIKLYNIKGSGLRAICISDFPTWNDLAAIEAGVTHCFPEKQDLMNRMVNLYRLTEAPPPKNKQPRGRTFQAIPSSPPSTHVSGASSRESSRAEAPPDDDDEDPVGLDEDVAPTLSGHVARSSCANPATTHRSARGWLDPETEQELHNDEHVSDDAPSFSGHIEDTPNFQVYSSSEEDPAEEAEVDEHFRHLQRQKEHLNAAASTLDEKEVPRLIAEEFDIGLSFTQDEFDRWIDWSSRNHQFWWLQGGTYHRVFVKHNTTNGNVRITRWNGECVKSVFVTDTLSRVCKYKPSNPWSRFCDRVPIAEDTQLGRPLYCIIIVHGERLIISHSHLPRPFPHVDDSRRRPFKQKQHEEYQRSAYLVYEADDEMWRMLSSPPLANGGGGSTIRSFRQPTPRWRCTQVLGARRFRRFRRRFRPLRRRTGRTCR